MQRAPLPENESSRLAELQQYMILDTLPETAFDELAALGAKICGTPIALINFVDAHRQWSKAKVGIDPPEIPREMTVCAHTIHGNDLFVVPDTAQDTRFADNPLLTADPPIRFYAGMPLVTPTGYALGTLCVLDQAPKQLTVDQMNALRVLGRQVVTQLELRKEQQELKRSLAIQEQNEQSKADIIRAIEHGLEGLAFLDQEGRYTYMNQAHAAIYGYKPEELVGRSWKTLYAPIWIAQIEEQYFPMLLHAGRWAGQVQGLTKSGQEIYTELSFVRSQEGQDPARWLMCTCRDVTTRVTAQHQLEIHQESLSQAQALAHVGSWEWDAATGTERWSDELFRIFGYAPQAITPTLDIFREAIHPDDRPRVVEAIKDSRRQNQPYRVTCRIRRPSGEVRHVLCRGTVTCDSQGRPTHKAGTVQDNTEQTALEQVLNETIQRLDLATKSGGIGVWDYYLSPEKKLVWDTQMYQLYGYTMEDFPAAYEAWTSRLHPEDKADAEAALQAAIEGHRSFDTEFRVVLPNQAIRYLKAFAIVLKDHRSNAVRIIGINYDITARKESERALRELHGFQDAILRNAPHAVIATTTTGIITHFNPAAERLLGYQAEEMIDTLTPTVFLDPEEVNARAQVFGAELRIELQPGFEVVVAKARLNVPNQHEWTSIRKDGARVPVLLSVTAIRDHAGVITGFLGMAIDVTALKESEQARLKAESTLRGNEAVHRAMIEKVIDYSIIRLDSEGHIVSWNEGAQRLKGYNSQEIIGLHFSHFYTKEDQSTHIPTRLLRAAIAHHHAEAEGWRVRKDGSRFWANVIITALLDQEGRLEGFTKVVRDMTTRKQAEEALMASEERLNLAVGAAQVGIFEYDHQNNTMYWSPILRDIFGVPLDEPSSPQRYVDLIHQADRDRVLAAIQQAHDPTENGEFSIEHHIVKPHGDIRHVSLRSRTYFAGEGTTRVPTRTIGTAVDITEQKRTEEQFRLVVESAPNGMLIVNQEGILTLVNTQIERWFGYDRHELVGQLVEILLPERYRSQHHGHRTAFFHTPQARAMGAGRDLFGRRKDSSEFPLEIGLSPIKTPEGTQVLASIVDITARKQAEEKLRVTAQELASKNSKLQEANQAVLSATRAKSEFLATMSHEIRTPMNAIIGMADLLQETALSGDQQEYVLRFSRAATSLMELLNNILDISRIEAGHFELESTPFDLPDLAERAVELLASRAIGKNIELMCFIHSDVPQYVLGDPTRLRQVLVNLIGNAIKFTEQGEVVLHIEPGNDPSAVHFSVRDTGIGIPANRLQAIFEDFSQVDSSTTRKYGGTGLGLSICKRIITLMGSTIEISSTEGEGSTFSFVLNLPMTEATEARPVPALTTLRDHRILIVDDNDTNRMIVREHLVHLGASCHEAPNGLFALTALLEAHQRGEPFHLAILDYHLPDMNGLILTQAIRQRPECAKLPLIIHTSQVRSDHTLELQALRVASYLHKPISRARLIQSVAEALDRAVVAPTEPVQDRSTPLPLSSHILLAEDLEDNRDVITLFLKGTACVLDIAENGAVAVEKFFAGTYDLVLMDIQMPVMDGYQATTAMRTWEQAQQRRPTPIVALTANAFQNDIDSCLRVGCTAYLSKPLKKARLLEAIQTHARTPPQQEAA